MAVQLTGVVTEDVELVVVEIDVDELVVELVVEVVEDGIDVVLEDAKAGSLAKKTGISRNAL